MPLFWTTVRCGRTRKQCSPKRFKKFKVWLPISRRRSAQLCRLWTSAVSCFASRQSVMLCAGEWMKHGVLPCALVCFFIRFLVGWLAVLACEPRFVITFTCLRDLLPDYECGCYANLLDLLVSLLIVFECVCVPVVCALFERTPVR